MPRVRKQQFPKDMSTQKVSGMSTAPFLEYPCFIAENRCFFFLIETIAILLKNILMNNGSNASRVVIQPHLQKKRGRSLYS